MSWIQAARSVQEALDLRPGLATRYSDFVGSFASDGNVPGELLALCRAHVRSLHQLGASDVVDLTDAEAAALKVADLIPFGHHNVSDDDVADLVRHFGPGGAVDLITAVAMYDAEARLERVWDLAAAEGN